MTFVPFVLSVVRLNIFPRQRYWQNGIDSYQPIDIGFVTNDQEKKEENIDMKNKMDTMQELQEKLKKI